MGFRLGGGGGNLAQFVAFEDTWTWDDAAQDRVDSIERALAHPANRIIKGLRTALGDCGLLAYLSYMAERLVEIRRVAKPSGSIYVHCDPLVSHYLKTVCDAVFDAAHFRNELAWKRTSAHSDARRWARVSDRVFYYAAPDATWQTQWLPLDPGYVNRDYRHKDKRAGRYRFDNLTGRGLSDGKSGEPWQGFDPGTSGRCWSVPKTGGYARWLHDHLIPGYLDLEGIQERLDALDKAGLIDWTSKGYPRLKRYLAASNGEACTDFVDHIRNVNNRSNEYLGYPTQKPLELLQWIIKASSNPGDVVLDPFCGCGTAVEAAYNLDRRFVGIDISHFAIDIVRERRLKDRHVPINGFPVDLHSAELLAREVPFEFEKWAVTRIPGMVPNRVQIGDGGIDGRGTIYGDGSLVLAQVKGGASVPLGHVRDFRHVLSREDAACGIFATLRPVNSSKAKAEAKGAGYFQIGANRYPKAQFWSIADYFDHRLPVLPPLADPYNGKELDYGLFAS